MEDQYHNSLYEMQSMAIAMGDGLGTHISIYLTIISSYLIVSYLVADKMTTLQISIATTFYAVAYFFQSLLLITYARSLFSIGVKIRELYPGAPIGVVSGLGGSYIGAIILLAGFIAPLWFMWSVRRGDSR